MVRNFSYDVARNARWLTFVLLFACASDMTESSDQSTTEEASNASGDGDDSPPGDVGDDDSDDSEPALDPGRSYPTSSGAAMKRDAGSSSVASGAPTQNPAAIAADEDRPPPSKVATPEPVNPFVDASKDPFSTFGADVDTASYDHLRQSLQGNALPRPSFVRAEDYINYFSYNYTKPATDAAQPFSIDLAAANHPIGRPTTLLRVGIQAKAAPAAEKKPANIVYLVDVSGSMATTDKLPLVKRVLEEGLKVLAPTDKVSIVTYAADTRVRLAPTLVSERDTIAQQIRGLESGGSTNGASGITLAYEQASAGFIQGGINHVILCTDGDFNVGITSTDALLTLVRQKRATGVTMTALGFGQQRVNDDMMEKVSNAGNGSFSLVYNEDQAIEYANERLLSTIFHVAKDMKIQVEFNPAQVKAYRLIGYENRAIADGSFRNDAVDGGEVGADHRVTALYELVLADKAVPLPAGAPPLSPGETSMVMPEIQPAELVRVKVRSKAVTATDADPATEVIQTLAPADIAQAASPDVAWASAVATVAEILRGNPYASRTELDAVQRIVEEQKLRDSDRSEFATLLTRLRALLPAQP